MSKKNTQFKKTVDEISTILKEEAKQKNIEKQKKNFHRTTRNKKNILNFGVIFFTLLVLLIWAIGIYPFFKKNNFKNTTNLIKNTKQDISDILNDFSKNEPQENKNLIVSNNQEKNIETSEQNEETKIIEKILLKIKESTSTEEIKK